MVALLGVLLDAAEVDANGADTSRVFFILAKMDENAKDCSSWSSSSNGLKEVRLVKSSVVSFVLLLDLDDCVLKVPIVGDETCGDSMTVPCGTIKRIRTRYLAPGLRIQKWTSLKGEG